MKKMKKKKRIDPRGQNRWNNYLTIFLHRERERDTSLAALYTCIYILSFCAFNLNVFRFMPVCHVILHTYESIYSILCVCVCWTLFIREFYFIFFLVAKKKKNIQNKLYFDHIYNSLDRCLLLYMVITVSWW